MTTFIEKYRTQLMAYRKASSKPYGERRMAQEDRACHVQGCDQAAKYYSRYCPYHTERTRGMGHPTLNLRVGTNADYQNVLKIGRWVREALSRTPDERRAWLRIEQALDRIRRDQTLKHSLPTMRRRHQAWRNEYKAHVFLSRRLEAKSAEEALAGFLGLAAVILLGNDQIVTPRQLQTMLCKAGARAIMRGIKQTEWCPEARRTFTYSPSAGTMTRVGKVVWDEIAKEFGVRWYKKAESELVVARGEGPLDFGREI